MSLKNVPLPPHQCSPPPSAWETLHANYLTTKLREEKKKKNRRFNGVVEESIYRRREGGVRSFSTSFFLNNFLCLPLKKKKKKKFPSIFPFFLFCLSFVPSLRRWSAQPALVAAEWLNSISATMWEQFGSWETGVTVRRGKRQHGRELWIRVCTERPDVAFTEVL